MAYLDLSSDSQDFWKILVLVPLGFLASTFNRKSQTRAVLKNKQKRGLVKFCFEIGELFEPEATWNITISEANEVILNKGKPKGVLAGHNSRALVWSSSQQNIFRKHHLLCNFLKLDSRNYAVCGGERIYSPPGASPKLRPHISNGEGSQRAIREARKMFSKVRSQNWLLSCGTTSRSCHQGPLLSS